MVDFTINAEIRESFGKGACRRLRRTQHVPAVLYGAGQAPRALSVRHHELGKQLEHEAFYSHILTVCIAGQEEKAVLKDLHRHPFKREVLHMDLLRVSETETLRMHVPLHFIGEDIAPGVKQSGGVISHLLVEIEIECYPKDLPEFIAVDLSKLSLGETIHMSQLKLPAGVVIVQLVHGGAVHDQGVATIHRPRAETEDAAGGDAAPGTPTPA